MKRTGLIGALAMLAFAGGIGVAAHPVEALEASPAPRKRRVVTGTYTAPPRTKRTPHIGAKERARHAGKPDGPMHRTPHEHRIFCKGE